MKKIIFGCLILATSFALAASNPFVTPDSPFIKKMKTTFGKFMQKHTGERIYVHTDKTLYQSGETLWFSAYLRSDSNLSALTPSQIMYVELVSPKGSTEQTLSLIVRKGVAQGDFSFLPDAVGGIYKLRAYTSHQKNDGKPYIFEKEITLQKVVLPRVLQTLTFTQKSYKANDNVMADFSLKNLKNEAITSQKLDIVVRLNNEIYKKLSTTTDAQGTAKIGFSLPQKLDSNDGLLNISYTINGNTESISRAIPIVLGNYVVRFFPEGGDMVVGLPCKIAFAAVNEFGKPAEISGIIRNQKGETLANIQSFHDGMGSFELTPTLNQSYNLRLGEQTFELPQALKNGYAMQVLKQQNNQINVKVAATLKGEMHLLAQMRGKVCFTKSFTQKTGANINIPTKNLPTGVLHITLFDAKNIERAERLVFVSSENGLNISVKPNKKQYQPREKVTLSILTTDNNGLPIDAQLSMAVVDAKNLSFADDKQGTILSKLLLEPDVTGEVYEPNFYFDKKEPKAAQALDNLLLTQGWRRFTWQQMLQADTSQFAQFLTEKAVIEATVYGENGEPEPNAKITVSSTKKQYITDKKGAFRITDLLLYEPDTLHIKTQKGLETTEVVYGYYPMSIYINRVFPMAAMMRGGVELQMAAGAVDEMAGEVAENVMMNNEIMPVENAPNMPNEFNLDAKVQNNGAIEDQVMMKPAPPQMAKKLNGLDDARQEPQADVLMKRLWMPPQPMPQAVTYYRSREFAAPMYDQPQTDVERKDFRSTIFWKGNIETDRKGKAEVSFYNADVLSNFAVTTEGICSQGNVARNETDFSVFKSLGLDCKLPVAMSFGDQFSIPILISNNTDKSLQGTLKISAPKAFSSLVFEPNISIEPKSTKTIYLTGSVAKNIVGKQLLGVSFGTENGIEDRFLQEIDIAAKGFPVNLAFSGSEKTANYDLKLSQPIAGSLRVQVAAYPTALSDLLAGIESILQEPSGCFEQTSSSTYPNIMVLDYLRETNANNPSAEKKALQLIENGYGKLTSFETAEKGYEWFGGTPAHEALSAYGLMEFVDMSKVFGGVSSQMVERTANWLLDRKDNAGGFKQSAQALDDFGRADKDITNAYIVWSLSEAGYNHEITQQLEAAYQNALTNPDAYVLGLVANALLNTSDERAESLVLRLVAMQNQDGSFSSKRHSITYTQGTGLKTETTSLAVMACIKSTQKRMETIEKATKFIVTQRQAMGGFGNTQTTIMALKALTAYAKFAKRTQESGDMIVSIDGTQVGKAHFDADQQGEIVVKNLEQFLGTNNKITVKFENCKDALPYTLSVRYNTEMPQSSEKCAIEITTKLSQNNAKLGETVRLSATIVNKTEKGQPMTLAIVGIPAGLSAQPWQLKELQDKKVFDFYEITPDAVVFYYRQMKPQEQKKVNLDLKTEFAGTYQAQASSAYLYYTTDYKSWAQGTQITIEKP